MTMGRTARANTPGIRQQTQYTCMAASVAACCMTFGKAVDENIVNKVLGAAPMRGARWEEALATLQYFGLRGHLVVPATLDMLRSWTALGYPVMIAWNPEGRPWSHASVVVEVDNGDNVHVMDPNCPDPEVMFRIVPKAEFLSKWSEKFSDSLLVRRPALVVTPEVTAEGQPVLELNTFDDAVYGEIEDNEGWDVMAKSKQPTQPKKTKQDPNKIKVDPKDLDAIQKKLRWEEMKKQPKPGGAGAHKPDTRYDRKDKHPGKKSWD